MSALLRVEGLEIRLPVAGGELHAVRGVDLALAPGEALCIVGESGCGKSLTALALIGLLPRRATRRARAITFDGTRIDGLGERAMADLRGRRMAMIFQDPMTSLNPTLTIGTQMTEGVRRHEGVRDTEARRRAVEMLERVGIADPASRLGQYPHQFSGGQRQRVMIAAALMGRPKLLIADEPTTALDVTIQAQILDLIDALCRELGLGLLLITHDLGVVARIADRVAVMYAGEVVEQGPATAIFATPRHPYTRALLAALPVPGRTPPGTPLAAIGGRVPELIGGIEGCAFRDRCPVALPRCATAAPPVHRSDVGQSWRCIHEAPP